MGRQPGAWIIGAGLLMTAAWTIAIGLGVPLARLNRMWTVVVAGIGLGMIIQIMFQRRKQPGLLFIGSNALVLGSFLSIFSLKVGGLTWAEMGRYWPMIPFTLGLSLFIIYLVGGMQDSSLITPAYVIGGLGLFAFPVTLGVVGSPAFAEMLQLWPLAVLLGALLFFFRPIAPRQEGGGGEGTQPR